MHLLSAPCRSYIKAREVAPCLNVAGGIDGRSLIGTRLRNPPGTEDEVPVRGVTTPCADSGRGADTDTGNGVWTSRKNNGGWYKQKQRLEVKGTLSLGLYLPAFLSSFHWKPHKGIFLFDLVHCEGFLCFSCFPTHISGQTMHVSLLRGEVLD